MPNSRSKSMDLDLYLYIYGAVCKSAMDEAALCCAARRVGLIARVEPAEKPAGRSDNQHTRGSQRFAVPDRADPAMEPVPEAAPAEPCAEREEDHANVRAPIRRCLERSREPPTRPATPPAALELARRPPILAAHPRCALRLAYAPPNVSINALSPKPDSGFQPTPRA